MGPFREDLGTRVLDAEKLARAGGGKTLLLPLGRLNVDGELSGRHVDAFEAV